MDMKATKTPPHTVLERYKKTWEIGVVSVSYQRRWFCKTSRSGVSAGRNATRAFSAAKNQYTTKQIETAHNDRGDAASLLDSFQNMASSFSCPYFPSFLVGASMNTMGMIIQHSVSDKSWSSGRRSDRY